MSESVATIMERLRAYQGCTAAIEALRIALRTLGKYAEDDSDAGQPARDAIKDMDERMAEGMGREKVEA